MKIIGTVYLIDPHAGQRESLGDLIHGAGLTMTSCASAREFLEKWCPDSQIPSCVICELELPDMSGLQLLEEMNSQENVSPMIVLTAHGNIQTAVEAIRNGAEAFFEKPHNHDVFVRAIHQALSKSATQQRQRGLRQEVRRRLEKLTRRERQVMQLMVLGQPSKSIADDLALSPRTVESHRAKVMRKMQVDSLPDLVRFEALLEPHSGVGYLGLSPELEERWVSSLL